MSLLFSPITIRTTHFRNRIVMPPMVREMADADGCVTEALLEHYERPALGGTGLIIVEATAVDAVGRVWNGGLCAYADRHLPGLARLAGRIHAAGAVAGIQLVHGGPQSFSEVTGQETVGPSAIKPRQQNPTPRALTIEEILAIQERFADAAERALEAGFDLIEIHGAHGYLLDSFLAVGRNQREDAYGGSLAGRMRILVETCRRVRERIGDRGLLECRISFFNKRPEEVTPDYVATLVPALEGTGLDLMHLSCDDALAGQFGTDRPMGVWVRQHTRLPLIVAGHLGLSANAERALVEGVADFAAVGGAMLVEPTWAKRARRALGA